MKSVSISDVRRAYRAGRGFRLYAEYVGYNAKNASGRSSKFWCVERGEGGSETRIRYGRIGTCGRVTNHGIGLCEALERLHKKEAKGYRIVLCQAEPAPAPKAAPVVRARAAAILEWAATLPAPFNTITSLNHNGVATDESGALVCTLPQAEAVRILGSL
jgi:predicted DNA-binding WGR domain protein